MSTLVRLYRKFLWLECVTEMSIWNHLLKAERQINLLFVALGWGCWWWWLHLTCLYIYTWYIIIMSVDFLCLFFVILDIVIHVDFALGYYIKQINGHITSQNTISSVWVNKIWLQRNIFAEQEEWHLSPLKLLECYTNCIYRMLVMCERILGIQIIVVAFLLSLM